MGFFLLSFLFSIAATESYLGGSVAIGAYGTLSFTINDENVTFSLEMNSRVWMAIGFGQGMSNVDMVVAEVQTDNVTITDLYSSSFVTPLKDEIQNYLVLNHSQTNSSYKVSFQRKLKTGDSKDTDLVPGSNAIWGWGIGRSELMERKHLSRGDLSFVFGTKVTEGTTPSTLATPPPLTSKNSSTSSNSTISSSKPKPSNTSSKNVQNLTQYGLDVGAQAGQSAGEMAGKLAGVIGALKEARKIISTLSTYNLSKTNSLSCQAQILSNAQSAGQSAGLEAGKQAGKKAGATAGANVGATIGKKANSKTVSSTSITLVRIGAKAAGSKAGATAGKTAGTLAGMKAGKKAAQEILAKFTKKK